MSEPITPTGKDGLIAGTQAAFESLIGLFALLAVAFMLQGGGLAGVFVALIVVAVGALFVPIASVLGWMLAWADAVRAAWLIGPLAGAAVGVLIVSGEDVETQLLFVGIGLVFGLVNAASFVRIMRARLDRTPMPMSPWSVGSGADESWSKGTTGEQPQNAEPEGVGQPCGPP